MRQKWLVLPENRHLSNWSSFSVAEDTKYAVCNSCKQKISRGGVTTNDYCFFISFKINSNRYNLNVKYRIGDRYRQISVIKNRNIRISAFSHIGASLIIRIDGISGTLKPLLQESTFFSY